MLCVKTLWINPSESSDRGLGTFCVVSVMHRKKRRVQFARITLSPNATWMKQNFRNLTGCDDGFWKDVTHLIVDRDNSFLSLPHVIEASTEIGKSGCHLLRCA